MKVKLTLEYDGTDFAGWQVQPGQRTVQRTLEDALCRLLGGAVSVEGAGRTDAGAHALGQVASLVLATSIPADRLALALNRLLPEDVKVLSSAEVPPDFHARFSAKGKVYRYLLRLSDAPSPLWRHRAWRVGTKLDVGKMEQAMAKFVGTHDFKAFCASGSSVVSTTRTIHMAKLIPSGDLLAAEFCGSGFLYHMVRIMVGALVAVGKGNADTHDIAQALARRHRPLAFTTAPAHGLYLVAIEY
jgi:tRNA pseudouridine38-40 synthase